MNSTWQGILTSIFDRCWSILGAMLGGKIEQKATQEGRNMYLKTNGTQNCTKAEK